MKDDILMCDKEYKSGSYLGQTTKNLMKRIIFQSGKYGTHNGAILERFHADVAE